MQREGFIPNKVVNDSAASRNSVVDTALSFSLSTGTSVKDFLSVSRNVPPGGYALVVAIFFFFFSLVFDWRGESVKGCNERVPAVELECGAGASPYEVRP
jgi:hypothetical protein